MTITLFVEPKSLLKFIEVTKILKPLNIINDYIFQPQDLVFSEAMISNYIWVTMDIEEYLKLKHCISILKK